MHHRCLVECCGLRASNLLLAEALILVDRARCLCMVLSGVDGFNACLVIEVERRESAAMLYRQAIPVGMKRMVSVRFDSYKMCCD